MNLVDMKKLLYIIVLVFAIASPDKKMLEQKLQRAISYARERMAILAQE